MNVKFSVNVNVSVKTVRPRGQGREGPRAREALASGAARPSHLIVAALKRALELRL